MDCLLLLILLFCCSGTCGCNTCSFSGRKATKGRSCAAGQKESCCVMRENNNRSAERDCDCGNSQINSCPTAPPPMPRTQFPYLDMEPRTCGCEENANS